MRSQTKIRASRFMAWVWTLVVAVGFNALPSSLVHSVVVAHEHTTDAHTSVEHTSSTLEPQHTHCLASDNLAMAPVHVWEIFGVVVPVLEVRYEQCVVVMSEAQGLLVFGFGRGPPQIS